MSSGRSFSFPLELVHLIFASATDLDVLRALTLVNTSAQLIADKILFRVFWCYLGGTVPSNPVVVAKTAFLAALCADTASPRITKWRGYLKVFSLSSNFAAYGEFDRIIESILKLCPNIVALNVNQIPSQCLQLHRPSLRYIRCALSSELAEEKPLSSPIFRHVRTFHPTHIGPDDWFSRLNSSLCTHSRLSQLALGINAPTSESLWPHIQTLIACLPKTVELVVLSGHIAQLNHDLDFHALREGRLDRRLVFCVPSLTKPVAWVLQATLFNGGSEFWKSHYGDDQCEDSFWRDARDILKERNQQLNL
ncbi:hypothetical protein DL96DRAFT_1638095 [Flagelloscypha sp. PMI_526]|nr:hypothetical protein DL96DRAFT_1638095 [Flagelloscypha sp. PMI_526]